MTTEPLADLTPTELRIRCAEAMGWRIEKDEYDPQYNCLVNPKGFYESIIKNGAIRDFCDNGTLPRYDENRNALHELILAVPEDKRTDFIDWVLANNGITDTPSYTGRHNSIWSVLTASPEAIMLAFLEVMGDCPE